MKKLFGLLPNMRGQRNRVAAYRQQKKGGIIVSSSKIRTTTYLPEDLYEQLRKEAYETKTSQAEIIEKALKEYFDKSEKNK